MNDFEHEMYREIILDYYSNPRNFGELTEWTHRAEKKNTSCGDRIALSLEVADGIVKDVRFSGEGCALSVATSSLLTEYLKGRKVEEVLKMDEKSLMEVLHVTVGIGRIKCLRLPLEVLQEALSGFARNSSLVLEGDLKEVLQ